MITLGTSDANLAPRLRAELWKIGDLAPMSVALNLAQLRAQVGRSHAQVIVLEDSLLDPSDWHDKARPEEKLHEFASAAPVVLLVQPENLSRFAHFMTNWAALECVTRAGDFLPLLAAFTERQIRRIEMRFEISAANTGQFPEARPRDFSEIFRHEINNPLTGILGNAEMVLAHRERLPASAIQRLQTVVDLAVRLRETTRRLSQSWEMRSETARSAS